MPGANSERLTGRSDPEVAFPNGQMSLKFRTPFVAALMAVSFACSPIQVRKESKVDVSNYHSYQWVTQNQVHSLHLTKPPVMFRHPEVSIEYDKDIADTLRPLVDHDFQQKGYVLTTNGNPDFYVAFYGRRKDQSWVSTWSGSTQSTQGVPLVIFPDYRPVEDRKHIEGVVYIVLYDAKTQRPVWTGSVQSGNFGPTFGEPELAQAVDGIVNSLKTS